MNSNSNFTLTYYPFGMPMPARNGAVSGGEYRYGFQAQEKDDEMKGSGNSLNFEYRMHDPRIGRFFAIDPLTKKYPHYSPYSFSGNRVIDRVELEGLEPGGPLGPNPFGAITEGFRRLFTGGGDLLTVETTEGVKTTLETGMLLKSGAVSVGQKIIYTSETTTTYSLGNYFRTYGQSISNSESTQKTEIKEAGETTIGKIEVKASKSTNLSTGESTNEVSASTDVKVVEVEGKISNTKNDNSSSTSISAKASVGTENASSSLTIKGTAKSSTDGMSYSLSLKASYNIKAGFVNSTNGIVTKGTVEHYGSVGIKLGN